MPTVSLGYYLSNINGFASRKAYYNKLAKKLSIEGFLRGGYLMQPQSTRVANWLAQTLAKARYQRWKYVRTTG